MHHQGALPVKMNGGIQMAIEGMAIDAMGPVLSTLNNAVQELETLIGSPNTADTHIMAGWGGKDATQFFNQWPSFASSLNQAHSGLQQLQQPLQANYNAQQQATNTY